MEKMSHRKSAWVCRRTRRKTAPRRSGFTGLGSRITGSRVSLSGSMGFRSPWVLGSTSSPEIASQAAGSFLIRWVVRVLGCGSHGFELTGRRSRLRVFVVRLLGSAGGPPSPDSSLGRRSWRIGSSPHGSSLPRHSLNSHISRFALGRRRKGEGSAGEEKRKEKRREEGFG
jgi:hypothetical protein